MSRCLPRLHPENAATGPLDSSLTWGRAMAKGTWNPTIPSVSSWGNAMWVQTSVTQVTLAALHKKKNWESPSMEKPCSEQVSSCLLQFSDMPTKGIYLGFGSNMIKTGLPVDQLESSVLRFDHLDPYLGAPLVPNPTGHLKITKGLFGQFFFDCFQAFFSCHPWNSSYKACQQLHSCAVGQVSSLPTTRRTAWEYPRWFFQK